MIKSIKLSGIGVFLFLLGSLPALSDIIQLKNGSTLEGKVIKQDKKSVVIELSNGTITIKMDSIVEIIKADIEKAEPDESKPGLKEDVKIRDDVPITPTIEDTSAPVSSFRDAPLVLNDEGKSNVQKEINEIIRKLVEMKESEAAWELAEKLIVKCKGDRDYIKGLLFEVQNRQALKWIIYAAGQFETNEIVKLFYEMLKTEPDESIRIALLEALGRMKNISTVDMLRKQLSLEKLKNVRVTVINMLSKAADVESLDAMLGFLDDKDEIVSRTAALAIMNIYKNAGSKALESVDFSTMLQKRAANAGAKGKKEIIGFLGQMNDRQSIDLLVKFLDDEDANIRSESVIALSAIQDAMVVDVLTGRLSIEKDLWTRMQIIQAIGLSKNQSLVPMLIDLLQDGEEKIRLCAARSLSKLTNKFLGDNYETWKTWWETMQGLK
ncbi:MAG: HEAT repeat domain-containing protein [Candidatus Brocadiia bacterium]